MELNLSEKAKELIVNMDNVTLYDICKFMRFKDVRADIDTFVEDSDYDLTDEHIEYAAYLYVFECNYDCNLDYWANIENVIKLSIEHFENEKKKNEEFITRSITLYGSYDEIGGTELGRAVVDMNRNNHASTIDFIFVITKGKVLIYHEENSCLNSDEISALENWFTERYSFLIKEAYK